MNSDLPTTPTRSGYSRSSIPSPKISSQSPTNLKRPTSTATSFLTSSSTSERQNGKPTISTKATKHNDCSSHLTSFYKENIRELNELQDVLFQKKAMLDSLNDELNECKTKQNGIEFKWESLKEEKILKEQQLTLKSNEIFRVREEQASRRKLIEQGHHLDLKRIKARHGADLNRMIGENREKLENLKFSKIKKFQNERDSLLDEVENIRNIILMNEVNLSNMLKELDTQHCSVKEKWLEEYQQNWKRHVGTNETLATEIDSLREVTSGILEPGVRVKKRKLQELNEQLETLENSLSNEKTESERLKKEIALKVAEIDQIKHSGQELQEYIENTELELKQIHEILMKEETMRRTLHNELQELRGNIRVFCRVRPPLGNENSSTKNIHVCEFDDNSGTQKVEIIKEKGGSPKYSFKFDRVFDQHDTNSDVFGEICQLVQSSLDGYNVCIFAYGQTGSGKTYTMLNPKDGIIPATISHIFNWIDNLKERGWLYDINCQFVEIYNEVIADLLRSEHHNISEQNNEELPRSAKHEIRHDQESRTTTITNVTTCSIKSRDSVEGLLKRANKLKSTATTAANDRSSRSHSIFIIHLNGLNKISGERSSGILNLVDLAGSERINVSQVIGERLRETQNINKSLSCLGDVIHALGSPDAAKRHIPFRNCKLTYLLQYSLMGNSKTLMFVNISPSVDNVNESLNSLRFASKVNSTKLITRKVD